jgi:hypothetical protein
MTVKFEARSSFSPRLRAFRGKRAEKSVATKAAAAPRMPCESLRKDETHWLVRRGRKRACVI